jgi:hypothetical protein
MKSHYDHCALDKVLMSMYAFYLGGTLNFAITNMGADYVLL